MAHLDRSARATRGTMMWKFTLPEYASSQVYPSRMGTCCGTALELSVVAQTANARGTSENATTKGNSMVTRIQEAVGREGHPHEAGAQSSRRCHCLKFIDIWP